MENLIQTLKATLTSITSQTGKSIKVVIGVSGGADSVSLAHAMREIGHEIIVAHFNHGLRGAESDADETFTQELAQRWKVHFFSAQNQMDKKTTGNLENNLRHQRYAFLESVRQKTGADFIAVAHHADDQIETILMHVWRGSGLRGQCGMPFFSENIGEAHNIIRPFLHVLRNEIEAYARLHSLEWRTDRSNFDLSFDRNYWRHLVIPTLKKAHPNLRKDLEIISQTAREKLANLSTEAENWLKTHTKEEAFFQADFVSLEEDLKAEVLIRLVGATDVYSPILKRLSQFLSEGHSGRSMNLKHLTFRLEHGTVRYDAVQVKKTILRRVCIKKTPVRWGAWQIESNAQSPLFVRPWKIGDRFSPSGMKGRKKLQDFFTDAKIPLHLRDQIPVITDENDVIMAVGDLRVANGAEHLKKTLSIKKTS